MTTLNRLPDTASKIAPLAPSRRDLPGTAPLGPAPGSEAEAPTAPAEILPLLVETPWPRVFPGL